MVDFRTCLIQLTHNLNLLHEREAKYGGNAPVELLNQIEDHERAIALTDQASAGQLSKAEWREALKALLVNIRDQTQAHAEWGVSIDDVQGGIIGAIIAGRDVIAGGDIVTGTKIVNIQQAAARLPLQRPPRPQHFINRVDELKKLLTDLQSGEVVTLCGPGGIGKTALAAEAIWHLAPADQPPDPFPDGILFHSFYNQPQAALALESIARAFGEEAKPTPRDAARRALAGRKALLLLDGTEDADDLPAVLGVAGGCGVIVTSRKHQDAPGEFQDITPLPTTEAIALLRAWGGDWAGDESAAKDICTLVGGLPLAVRLVGRYLAQTGETAAEYLGWLRETPLEALSQGKRRLESVNVLLERSLKQVSETACQVLTVTSVLALAFFDRQVIATALEMEPASLRRPLDELVNFGLFHRRDRRYMVSHALIRTYIRQCLCLPAEAVTKVASYYTQLAQMESRQGREGFARLNNERPHFLAILENCEKYGAVTEAFALIWATDKYLDYQGYNTERWLALETGLRLANQTHNQQQQANCIKALGEVHYMLDEYEVARVRFEEARLIFTAIGDRLGEINCLKGLGEVHRMLSEYEAARVRFEEARHSYAAIGHRLGEANCIYSLGEVHRMLVEYEAARVRFEEARPIFAAIGHRLGEANCIKGLGEVHRMLSEYEAARVCFEEARQSYAVIGDRLGEANCIKALGEVHRMLSEFEVARVRFEEARLIFATIGDRFDEANCIKALGEVHRMLAEYEAALMYFEEARSIFAAIGTRLSEANCLRSLGQMAIKEKQWTKATDYLYAGLQIYQAINSVYDVALSHYFLGQAAAAQTQPTQATNFYKIALERFKSIGLKQQVDMVLHQIEQLGK